MDESRRPSPETDPVSLVGADAHNARELGDLPAYVIDLRGTLRWFGLFGRALPRGQGRGKRSESHVDEVQLTSPQAEVLLLLGEGLSTDAIASRLAVAAETARNHIRGVLRGLGVHSRLETVVEGRERGLLGE